MTYGQTRLGQLLDSISLGFQQTPLEILLFFFIVFALLTVFVVVFFAQRRKATLQTERRSREILEHLLGKLDLNEGETALLGRLVTYLNPGESEHSLLVSHHIFSACARKMRQSEEISESTLTTLRVKIGLTDTQPLEVPGSSSELPEGSAVLLVAPAGARFHGIIIAQEPNATSVRLSAGDSAPGKGVRVSLYFHNSAGIYSFPSRIVGLTKDVVNLERSSSITFHQPRRKYFRRKEFLPVFVRLAASLEPPYGSILLDLGGGGASLQNPKGLLKKGDVLELSFSPETEEHVLAARVVRVSKAGKVIHLKFEPLSETERKRVMTFIFAQSRRQGNLSGRKSKRVDVVA
jgi:c-di-GMP-binding flagellar brake protein YcgR